MSNGGPLRSRPIHEIQVNFFNQSAVTLKSTSRRPRDATSYIYSLPFQKQGQEYSFKHKFKSIIEYNLARVAIIDGDRCCKQGCISDMLRIILLNLFSLSITGWLDGSVAPSFWSPLAPPSGEVPELPTCGPSWQRREDKLHPPENISSKNKNMTRIYGNRIIRFNMFSINTLYRG